MLRYIVAWSTVDWERVREPREAVGKNLVARPRCDRIME